MFSCRECRALLPGYLHRELSPEVRRRVAQHLQTCDACDALCRLERELAQQLPLVGQPDAPRLGKIWQAVQRELAAPRPARRPPMRHSLAVVALVMALLLPWTLRGQSASALPTPPTPASTTELPAQPSRISATAAPTRGVTPPFEPNYAPVVETTDTPS